MLVSETEIRSYLKCTEYSFLGGRHEPTPKLIYMDYLYTRVIMDLLKDNEFDYKFSLNVHSKHLETKLAREGLTNYETKENIRHAILGTNQIFELLKPNLYLPIFGPYDYVVNVSASNIKLNIRSLLMANPKAWGGDIKRNKTLHAVVFSPYSNARDMETDLTSLLKIYTLGINTPLNVKTTKAKLHLFSIKDSSEELIYTFLEYDQRMTKHAWLNYIEAPIKLMESKYHFPLSPCAQSCEFKSTCYPTRRLK